MHILVVHQYFLGKKDAGGSRWNQFAKYWACAGHKITVLAGTVHYATGEKQPEYKGKVTLIMVAVPSRTDVEDYQKLRNRLEQLVGRINGEHGSIGYIPVWYLYRYMPFHKITALYHVADVALVTPLRDGMNLIGG